MDFFLCKLVLLSRVFLVTPTGLYYDFKMITDFSNKVLNNNLTEGSQSSSRSLLDCSTQCGHCCGCFGFNALTKVCRVFKTCDKADVTEHEEGWIYHSIKESAELVKPRNCQGIFERRCITSGIYTIYPWDELDVDFRPVDVFCDMGTLDGGWTILQRRIRGSTDFNQSWSEYKTGFGNLEENFWIGNEVIHQFTKNKPATLYMAITLVNGTTLYQVYRRFSVADEADKFRLFLQEPEPNGILENRYGIGPQYLNVSTCFTGDSIVNTGYTGYVLHSMPFSTYDQNNAPDSTCCSLYGCGWWINACYAAYLNGRWKDTSWEEPWAPVVTKAEDISSTVMMIRPN